MSHCTIGVWRRSKRKGGTNYAELDKIYFCTVKFSTQVLISVWKIGSPCPLTSLSSTRCSCLHNFSASPNSESNCDRWLAGSALKMGLMMQEFLLR